MTITEATRHQLHQALITKLGEEEATTLMEHLPPVGWADVATNASLAATTDILRAEMNRHREHTDSEFALVRAEMATGFARSDERMQAMLNTHLRWMIGTMVASYGFIAAVAGLLH